MDHTLLNDITQLQMHALSVNVVEISWLQVHHGGQQATRVVRGLATLDDRGKELAERIGPELDLAVTQIAIYYPRFHKLAFTAMAFEVPVTYDLTIESDILQLGRRVGYA